MGGSWGGCLAEPRPGQARGIGKGLTEEEKQIERELWGEKTGKKEKEG